MMLRLVLILSCLANVAIAAEPVVHWSFDGELPESDQMEGNSRSVEGVVGQARIFDGYTSVLVRETTGVPRIDEAFTIEGWIAVAAYPWNNVPIVDHRGDELGGFSFTLGPRGELSVRAVADWREHDLRSPDGAVPLKAWTHVAARYSPKSGLALFIDGESVAKKPIEEEVATSGRVIKRNLQPATGVDLLIGGVRQPVRPSPWHRYEGTQPSWYSLDGALDELKLYDVALRDREIRSAARAATPGSVPFEPRILPSGPPGKGKFGAVATKLEYFPEWDALWRVSQHPDIVVRFDSSPARVVFWRGTQYSPAWVTGNNLWMADQSVEGYDEGHTWEHMNDKQNRYSHVRIIENHDARVVVHWRYAPVDVKNRFYGPEPRTGNAPWIDEYYTFYPDAMGVRNVTWQHGSLLETVQFQETIPLAHPGQTQGEVVEKTYATIGNLKGETQTLAYVDDPALIRIDKDAPDDLAIQMHHFRSDQKPFIVFEPGNDMGYLWDLDARSLSRPGSSSHWPVGQIRSDGRTAQALDRASSFLGFPISNPPITQGPDGRDHWAGLYGMTEKPFEDLVTLARSWSQAPKLTIEAGSFESLGYDRTERAYRLRRTGDDQDALDLSLEASIDSPIQNIALVLEGWGERGATLAINGNPVPKSADFRAGHRHKLTGSDLIIWIDVQATEPLDLSLSAAR